MENKFNIELKSEIMERQADYLFRKVYEQLGDTLTEEDVAALVSETIKRYYVNLGRPLMIKRYTEKGHLPFIEDYNDTLEEVTEDVTILFNEIERMGDHLADYFNYAQSEKERVKHRVRAVTGLANDLHLIANDSVENAVYFKDSFDDTKNIDYSKIMGEVAQVSTQEGIVTLSRKTTINRSQKAKVKSVNGNGEAGTFHVARTERIQNKDGTVSTVANYLSDNIPNNNPDTLLDGRPDTIFEYQTVNVPLEKITDVAKGYDFEWAQGKKDNDKLRLQLILELESAVDVNWININPYHPLHSTGKVIVYSIRTSEDGFEYKALYEDGQYILNSEINTTPQTYRADAVFDGSNEFSESKFAGQGVWAFPTRKAKYVEVVFDQVESYTELVGHTYYKKIKKSVMGETLVTRVPSSEVPKNIVDGAPGVHPVTNELSIEKGIETFEGWRYAVGLRDINVMSYEFADKSELVTKRYTSDQEISKIMLYANEKIPKSYLDIVSTSNDWIQYYISVDDVNWHRISPMHHQPVSKESFPAKIVEFNGNKADLENAFQLYKEYVDTEEPVKGVRLKVIIQRPADITNSSTTTPVLEDYALRVVFKDEYLD